MQKSNITEYTYHTKTLLITWLLYPRSKRKSKAEVPKIPPVSNFSLLQSLTALSRNLFLRGLVARSDKAQKGSDVVVLCVFVTF